MRLQTPIYWEDFQQDLLRAPHPPIHNSFKLIELNADDWPFLLQPFKPEEQNLEVIRNRTKNNSKFQIPTKKYRWYWYSPFQIRYSDLNQSPNHLLPTLKFLYSDNKVSTHPHFINSTIATAFTLRYLHQNFESFKQSEVGLLSQIINVAINYFRQKEVLQCLKDFQIQKDVHNILHYLSCIPWALFSKIVICILICLTHGIICDLVNQIVEQKTGKRDATNNAIFGFVNGICIVLGSPTPMEWKKTVVLISGVIFSSVTTLLHFWDNQFIKVRLKNFPTTSINYQIYHCWSSKNRKLIYKK